MSMRPPISSFFYTHVSKHPDNDHIISTIIARIDHLSSLGLLDRHFHKEIFSSDKSKFYQRLWEVNFAHFLINQGFQLKSQQQGPDFLIENGNNRIFIECTSPSPQGSLIDHYKIPKGQNFIVRDYPHNEIMLRITSSIYDKKRAYDKYIENGIVTKNDILIIAIDSSQLDFAAHIGISQKPVLLEATYPVGP